MSDTSSILNSKNLFIQTPNVNNFGTIQALVSAQTPIASSLNGMQNLKTTLAQLRAAAGGNAAGNNQLSVNFRDIDSKYQFNLFKVVKSKIIFARYNSRVMPDLVNQQQQNVYNPQVQFKIDYDAACIGAMTLLLTMDIQVMDFKHQSGQLNINGYSALGTKSGIQVDYSDVKSIQMAYGPDFIYNYIDYVSIGWANTGGNSPIYHQQVPIEVAKIYHAIIEDAGRGEVIKRCVREDVFVIGHNPFHMYGDFQFQIKADKALAGLTTTNGTSFTQSAPSSNAGFNEIGMYWVDSKIKGISLNQTVGSKDANPYNYCIAFDQMAKLGTFQKDGTDLVSFNYRTLLNYKFGSYGQTCQMNLKYNLTNATNLIRNIRNSAGVNVAQTTEIINYIFKVAGNTRVLEVVDDADQVDYSTLPFTTPGAGNFSVRLHARSVDNAITITHQNRTDPVVVNDTSIQIQFDKMMNQLPVFLIATDGTAESLQNQLNEIANSYTTMIPQIVVKYGACEFYTATAGSTFTDNTMSETISFIPYVLHDSAITNGSNYSINYSVVSQGSAVVDATGTYYKLPQFADFTFTLSGTNYLNVSQELPEATINPANIGSVISNKFVCVVNKQSPFNYFSSTGQYSAGTDNNQIIRETSIESVTSSNIPGYNFAGTLSPVITLSAEQKDVFNISNASGATKDLTTAGITKENMISNISSSLARYMVKALGAVSPYSNAGNVAYMNMEFCPFSLNDFMLNGLQWYYVNSKVETTSGNYSYQNQRVPNTGSDEGTLSMYKYNAAILNNQQNEEYCPTIQNVDYLSIHTYREYHGIVDFYFPLSFLFICQGLENSFPHYACASQSIIVKFDFLNPLAFINTAVSVNPTAIDPLDYNQTERIFINRISPYTSLISNISNMKYILFYTRFTWIPELLDIISGYKFYSWITRNYERFLTTITLSNTSTSQLAQFARSVFYTKIWAFFTNADTINAIVNKGAPGTSLPLYLNRYDLPIFEVLTYNFSTSSVGGVFTGTDANNQFSQYNSVYSLVPIESIQLQTQSQILMSDSLPYRFQQFSEYLMLDHTKEHQSIKFNNLLQINIDPIYYQTNAPNCVYSPAYAPAFIVNYVPKSYFNQTKTVGVIIISECINISYIQSHIMLVKYQTSN